MLSAPHIAHAQGIPPAAAPKAPAPREAEKLQDFAFESADLDTVMTMYCDWTDKIYLKSDEVKATITLKASKLTTSESIKVVEAILAMNNIALVPMGDKYIKVVPATAGDLTGQGLPISMDPDKEYARTDKFVTQIFQLKNVEIPEVQAAIQHVMHAYGKIMALQRSNSLMITDTEANIRRAKELIEFIDQASAKVEPRIYEIKYAEAQEIASKLNEIITMAQADQKKTTPAATGTPARTPPGVIRARSAPTKPAAPTKATISQTESGSTVIIQGTVKVMADERTNIIIIFSQEENFEFFDQIIKVLDVEVEPATTYEVVQLEYADAPELAGTLNDLIGAAGGSSRSSSGISSKSKSSSKPSVTPNASPAGAPASIENLNRLSEDTKILADERTNAIILMGSKSDIAVIKKVIASLDVMLEQVVIEAAIFEVTLDDSLRHGIDWLYRRNNDQKIGGWDGSSLVGTNSGIGSVTAGALTYYQRLTGINTEIAIDLAATDSNVRLLNNPVIMATDNTEARLSVGKQRPVVTSTDSYGNTSGTRRSSYEYKDIGIQLTVTPHINPQRVVVMEISQQADQLGPDIEIDGNPVPTIFNREFEAQVSVPDGTTIALGGLINTTEKKSSTKIPILGDIPLIGHYLFSSANNEGGQEELIVLLTPHVLTTADEATQETERLYDATDMSPEDWNQRGWSGSPLQYRNKEEPEPVSL